MSDKYILGIDQSTAGTKALLFSTAGDLIHRSDISHRQIIDDKGGVEHDPMEIYSNTLEAVKNTITESGISKSRILLLSFLLLLMYLNKFH